MTSEFLMFIKDTRLRVKDIDNSAVNQESFERQVFRVSQRTPYLQYANTVE